MKHVLSFSFSSLGGLVFAAGLQSFGCSSPPRSDASGGNGAVSGAGGSGTSSGGAAATGGAAQSSGGSMASGGSTAGDGAPCGYEGKGKTLRVSNDVEVCLPPTICNSETCPADVGTCTPSGVDGTCVYKDGYQGLKTLPEAWATWYCDLATGCKGTLEDTTVEVHTKVKEKLGLPYCYEDASGKCLGIVALSPILGGNSRLAKGADDQPLAAWGLGLTPASGLCYEVVGPEGASAVVAITDRCAGYCACDAGRSNFEECGNCLLSGAQSPESVTPSCPCVGDVPPMGAAGEACSAQQTCDWCMSANHPHFDLDQHTFNHICGSAASAGSCKIASVTPVSCFDPVKWPCDPGSWFCFEENASGRIPGTYCCQ